MIGKLLDGVERAARETAEAAVRLPIEAPLRAGEGIIRGMVDGATKVGETIAGERETDRRRRS